MNKIETVAVGADHGGFPLKENIKAFLQEKGFSVIDCGTDSTQDVDYPKFAFAVAKQVADGNAQVGVVVDGAGIGSAMAANKVAGVRASLCYDLSSANNAREHNDANVLTLGSGLIGQALARQIVEKFLNTFCTVERHLRRVEMINELDHVRELDVASSAQSSHVISEGGSVEISNEDISRIAHQVGQLVNPASVPSAINVAPQANAVAGKTCGADMVCQCGVCTDRLPDTMRKFHDFGVERFAYHDGSGGDCIPEDIARCIDHTILKPDTKVDDIKRICAEAREYSFASVCVSPSYVPMVAEELAGTPVKVCTVVGFPSGAHMPEVKAMETRNAIRHGAQEIDMVINIGALKSGLDELVYRDIRGVCEACEDGNAISKVIIETSLLSDEEKVRACELAKRAKANFVKSSTGFAGGGATAEDVALMNRVVASAGMAVKASGGVGSFTDAETMVQAGASRIGASAGIKIVKGAIGVTISN
jgi:deoxyribose-phosphate aldolase